MTPLLPNPDYYIANLITMTSSEATRLWRRAIKESFGCTCVYCGKSYDLHDLTIDHVRPRSCGGETISSNCVPACLSCNQDKGSENWEEWMLAKFGFHPERKQLILDHINGWTKRKTTPRKSGGKGLMAAIADYQKEQTKRNLQT